MASGQPVVLSSPHHLRCPPLSLQNKGLVWPRNCAAGTKLSDRRTWAPKGCLRASEKCRSSLETTVVFLWGADSISGLENLMGIMQLASTSPLPGSGPNGAFSQIPVIPSRCFTYLQKITITALLAYPSIREILLWDGSRKLVGRGSRTQQWKGHCPQA